MGCLKRFIGGVLFLGGVVGCLYYIPPTILEFDPSTGANLMDFLVRHIKFLAEPYGNMAVQTVFHLGSPVVMLIVSGVVAFLGFFLMR